MQTIYQYKGLFGKTDVINKINEIAEKIEIERSKNDIEYDAEKEKELVYAQFIQGLKLSTR